MEGLGFGVQDLGLGVLLRARIRIRTRGLGWILPPLSNSWIITRIWLYVLIGPLI